MKSGGVLLEGTETLEWL